MAIRFDPSDLVDYMGPKPIKVFNKNLEYPIQEKLFELLSRNPWQVDYGFRTRIGNFYEILTTGIFGGRWVGTQNASQNENETFQPDVITQDKIIESKSVCWKETLKLTDFQIDKYLVHQCDGSKPNKIFFAVYKYKLRNPLIYFKQFKKNVLEEMVKTLSQETAFMMFLPFSVVSNLHNPDLANSEFKSRYEKGNFDPISRFNSTGIKRMLQFPEEVLESYSLNPDDYLIKKTRFPREVKMNQYAIKPFPILFIEDKNHKKWLETFKKDNLERVLIIKKEDNKKKDYLLREEGCSDTDLEEENSSLFKDGTENIPF